MGETIDGSSGEDDGKEKTVDLPDFTSTRANRTSKPLSEDVETALQILESEAERTHRYRQSLEDARAVVRFTQRVSSDDELLQIVDQIERLLEDVAEK